MIHLEYLQFTLEQVLPMITFISMTRKQEVNKKGEIDVLIGMTVEPKDLEFFCKCGYANDIRRYIMKQIHKQDFYEEATKWDIKVVLN